MPVADDPELTPASESVESFDPTAVPSTFDPPPSSDAPEGVGSHPDDEHGAGDTEQEAPLPTFDERHREAFTGLLFLGALKDTFEWAGHRFSIRTLRSQELVDCGVATRKYQGTDGQMKAFQTAIMAACLIDVDGQGVAIPIVLDANQPEFDARFVYMMKNWFPGVADAVYNKYILLEITAREVIEALGGLSG